MKLMRLLLLPVWVGLFLLPACGQEEEKNTADAFVDDPPESWKTFETDDYTIRYPDSLELEVDKTDRLGARFFLYFPPESEDDPFRENINLSIEDLQGMDISLSEYADLGIQQVKSSFPEVKVLDSSVKTDKDGNKYYRIKLSGLQWNNPNADENSNARFELDVLQHCRIGGGKAYVLTLTTWRNSPAGYQKTGEQILSTFRLKQ